MIVEVMDKDRLTKDDIIGACSINLQDLQTNGAKQNWYPLFYKNKPAGEILMETSFQGGDFLLQQKEGFETGAFTDKTMGFNKNRMEEEVLINQQQTGIHHHHHHHEDKMLIEEAPRKVFTEQHQVVEPHTFMKNVDVVETVPVLKQIEVTEPRKVLREVEYTEAVPVTKTIEVVEPEVVMKEVNTVEPRVVTKTIQVIENVPVTKQVEVVEMRHTTKQIETFEPQTFHKQVEVIEQVPVMKTVEVSEPVTVSKSVEFVEDIITTQTVRKEIYEPMIVDQKITTQVGPATLVGVREDFEVRRGQEQFVGEFTEKQRWGKEGCFTHHNVGCTEKSCFDKKKLF